MSNSELKSDDSIKLYLFKNKRLSLLRSLATHPHPHPPPSEGEGNILNYFLNNAKSNVMRRLIIMQVVMGK
jgi:hypothetical protein